MSKSEKSKTTADNATATAVLVGLDFGTNTTVLAASHQAKPLNLQNDIVKSVVGFPKEGIIPGILPSDTDALFGTEAIDYRLHLDLKWPLHEGCVHDVEVSQLFAKHLRHLIDEDGKLSLWGVVGAPANSSPDEQKNLRRTMAGVFDRLLVVPEPFLAAMGLRDDAGFRKGGSASDPTKHSLIVDVGAGTTDLCLVRGYYPTASDQISFPQAGNFVDDRILEGVSKRYPDLNLTRVTVTQMKEDHSFVEGYSHDAKIKVYVDGRPRVVDFTGIIQEACNALVPMILKDIKELLGRCDSDSIVNVMENIIITGGGSQIHGLAEKLQTSLVDEGYDCARILTPRDYKRLVARGALKIAEHVREDQWQVPM